MHAEWSHLRSADVLTKGRSPEPRTDGDMSTEDADEPGIGTAIRTGG